MRIWNTSTPWVSCDDCLANTAYGETKEEAIEQWNRRADKLEGQPTAYDPDKVVEQLETMRMRYYLTYANTGNKTNDEVWEKVSRAVDNAIEIVKGGGV